MHRRSFRQPAYSGLRAGFILAALSLGLMACAQDNGRIPEGDAIAKPTVPATPEDTGATTVTPQQAARPRSGYQVPEGFDSRLDAGPDSTSPETPQPPTTFIDSSDEGKVRVALLLPLTGDAETIGKAMMNIATLAVFDLADDRFDLRPLDTQGTPAGARAAAERAVSEGAQLILGPLFSESFAAVTPVARAAGINVIGFTNDLNVAGPGAYVMGFTPEQQIDRVVAAGLESGARRYAALLPSNAYGQRIAQSLRSAVAYRGGETGDVVFYDPAAEDISGIVRQLADYDQRAAELKKQRRELAGKTDSLSKSVLRRLENLDTVGDPDFDAIILAEGGGRQRAIAALLPFYDIDPGRVRVMGTFLWDQDPSIGTEPALTGGWFAAPEPAGREDIWRSYRDVFGTTPPRLASLAYDAAALAAVLAQGEGGPRFDSDTLTTPTGFQGTDGLFRFRPDGQSERGLAVLELTRAQPTVVSPAPRTFSDAIN